MKQIKILILSIICVFPFVVFAQSDIKNYDKFWSLGIGIGADYGNYGMKFQTKLSRGFGLSVGIGTNNITFANKVRYFNASPSLGGQNADQTYLDRKNELVELGLPYTINTFSGLSVSGGFDWWVWRYIYIGFYYNYFGDYQPLLDNKKTIHGFSISAMGWIPFGKKVPLSVNIGGYMGFGFGSEDRFVKEFMHSELTQGKTRALFFGLNAGIAFHRFFRNYKVRYKNTLKKLEQSIDY